MIVIETNINKSCKIHDSIKYATIEKQLFDILSERLQGLSYKVEKKIITLFYKDITIHAEIKKSINLTIETVTRDWFNDFEIGDIGDHDRNLPSITLPFNKDITNKINNFIEKIIKIQELKDLARPLFEKVKREEEVLDKAITDYMNDYFRDGMIDVRLWIESRKLFDGFGLGFHIKPIDHAPADGVYFLLETNGKLDVFWNCLTPRRSSYGRNPDNIEKIFNRANFLEGIPGMKHKVEALENLEKKLKEFDYTKCHELVKFIEYKKEANKIKEEFDALC